MKKLMILSIAALSTLSVYASTTINVDMELCIANEVIKVGVVLDETENYCCQENGLKFEASVKEVGEEVFVSLAISGQKENGEYILLAQPEMTLAWGIPGMMRLGNTRQEGAPEDMEDTLTLVVAANH